MKRLSALVTFIAMALLLSTLLTPPAAADKKKKQAASDASRKAMKSKAESSKVNADDRQKRTASEQTRSAAPESEEEGIDPDLPPGLSGIDKESFLEKRAESIARLRGVEPGRPFDLAARGRAIAQMERRETELRRLAKNGFKSEAVAAAWVELGPNPIPNGQTSPSNPVSGRVTAIEIHPTNPNLVYVGTAQGGVFRSNNGGTNWTPIFDNAQSLAIGALALAPSNPSILYVGTGEANGSSDSFAGVGLYRIDNADTTTGALSDLIGPINPVINTGASSGGSLSYNAFNGLGIGDELGHGLRRHCRRNNRHRRRCSF